MPEPTLATQHHQAASTVYGPVKSWRVGASLGIDLLFQTSICSFNCIYCQLGDIQQKTSERKLYVETEKVVKDLKQSAWESADMITFSGSGEPTLALNLAEVIHFVKEYTHKPVMVLTNGTLLGDPAVRKDLRAADMVSIKLDASTDEGLKQMNRPVAGITLEGIVSGAEQFRKEYAGKLCLQCMVMPTNRSEIEALPALIKRIAPDEVQLNTPKRPYPKQWVRDSRGNHPADGEGPGYPAVSLRVIDLEEAEAIEAFLKQQTGVPIISVYQPQ